MSRVSSDLETAEAQVAFRLILFVAGSEPNSAQARKNLERICAEHLQGRCEIDIVDVLTDYRTALKYNILVTPCLLKTEPQPRALVAGTLQEVDKVRTALQLPSA